MADDEMAIMEEGGMEEEEDTPADQDTPEPEEDAEEASPVEANEEPAAEEGAEDAEEEGGEGEEGEGGEEVLGDEAVGDEELGIRDEDQGRPVTALRLPPSAFILISSNSSFSQKSVSFADPPAPSGDTHQGVLTRMIRGMWASREMLHENSDKQLFMKTTLRELIIYCVFLFVIVYMTFGQYSSDFYLLRLIWLFLFETRVLQVPDWQAFWEAGKGDPDEGLLGVCRGRPDERTLLGEAVQQGQEGDGVPVPVHRAESSMCWAPVPLPGRPDGQEYDVRKPDVGGAQDAADQGDGDLMPRWHEPRLLERYSEVLFSIWIARRGWRQGRLYSWA